MNTIVSMSIVRNSDGVETGRIFLDTSKNGIHTKKKNDEYYLKKVEFNKPSEVDRGILISLKMVGKEIDNFDIVRLVDWDSNGQKIQEIHEIIPYDSDNDKKIKYIFENTTIPEETTVSFKYSEKEDLYAFEEVEQTFNMVNPKYFGQIKTAYEHMKESDNEVETMNIFEGDE